MQCADKNSCWQLFMSYSHASFALNVRDVTIWQRLLFFFTLIYLKDFTCF
jgi:hypothetical protein